MATEEDETNSELPKTEEAFKTYLIGTSWVFSTSKSVDNPLIFRKDGTFSNNGLVCRYKVTGLRKVVITWGSDTHVNCVIAKDWKTMAELDGARGTLVRVVKDKAPPSAQILTQQQLSGIVIIEGDKGVGSGFLTKIDGNPCVVTNLHVLGSNTKFTIKTLAGKNVKVDVKSLKAAVDADIALLGLVEDQEELFTLKTSENVLDSTKIGNEIVVVVNRLGGGVATQTIGYIRGIGPTRIEVDAKFQSGNSGSPIYDIKSGLVVSVASYTETISADKIAGDKLENLSLMNETRWFGYRLDSVKTWQPLQWNQWRKQISSMEDYHNASMGALAILKGDLSYKHSDITIQRMVTSFRNQNGRIGKNKNTADLFSKVARYLSGKKKTFNRVKFYNYFHSCPYWENSLPNRNYFEIA